MAWTESLKAGGLVAASHRRGTREGEMAMRDWKAQTPGAIVRQPRLLAFAACCLWIAAVSVHDAALVVLHDQCIEQFEQNPLGRWLLHLAAGEVWLLVLVKFMGTAVVCATLITLYMHNRRVAFSVAGSLAVFQMILLSYLTLA